MEVMRSLLHDLHIDPAVILVNIVGFLILLALLRRFFFGPVGRFLAERRQEVARTVTETEAARQQATEQLAGMAGEREAMRAAAQAQANQVHEQARTEAEELLSQARQQALAREQRAQAEILAQQAEALAQARAEVAQLSVAFAERVLRESLRGEQQTELLEAAVRDVEELARRNGR